HLVTLVTGGACVVEGVTELGVAADEVGGLDEQAGDRVVDPATLVGCLGPRNVDEPVLGVVHVHRPFGHAVGDDGSGHDHTVAIDRLDPLVVTNPDPFGVGRAHPDDGAAAGQAEHQQVVLILGVDGPLV